MASRTSSSKRYAGDEFGITDLVGPYWSFDDLMPNDPRRRDIERESIEACGNIVAAADGPP